MNVQHRQVREALFGVAAPTHNMETYTTSHKPVMREEVLDALRVRPGGRYVDCTLGAGGHARAIMEKSATGGQLLGIDADPAALELARAGLEGLPAILVNDNFANLKEICAEHNFAPVQGILLDLGLSSMQIDERGRGFSFQQDAPLDMRFGPDQDFTAADLVNQWSETELADIIWRYGEERHSRQIARYITRKRPLHTTIELANAVSEAVGGRRGHIHPATRTFQALRIAVNEELSKLESILPQAVALLDTGGRLAVISYHSLEDRIVKDFMRSESQSCRCPPSLPVCVCDQTPTLRLINKKVITPSPGEIRQNPRSRSARMRIAERI